MDIALKVVNVTKEQAVNYYRTSSFIIGKSDASLSHFHCSQYDKYHFMTNFPLFEALIVCILQVEVRIQPGFLLKFKSNFPDIGSNCIKESLCFLNSV